VTHKLLLADDSVTIQRVVELTFSGEDVQVVTVGDGEQAIARIPIERPDIVLADIGMPKRSGYEVSSFVKNRPDLAHIPVLLLAGAFEPVDEVRAQLVKCDGVLVKPFEPQQVISRVRELVDSSKAKAAQQASPAAHAAPAPAPAPHVASPELKPQASPAARTEHREPSPEFRVPSPAARVPDPDPPLDDYFERLDAAFAGLGGKHEEPPSLSPEIDDFRASDVPTVDRLLGSTPLHDVPGARSMANKPLPASTIGSSVLDPESPARRASDTPEAAPATSARNPIADIFTALFAVEQGEPGAEPVRLSPPPAAAPVAVTDAMVDEVTRRVIERLAPDAAHDLVREIVSEVAERLIRDEITRIKAAVGPRQ
jgi:CheY-like chemotaxis protein